MTGTELISNELSACLTQLASSPPSASTSPSSHQETNNPAAEVKKYLMNIEEHLQGICDTNNFMLMTINRCLDYTKASNGMKLVPKFETVNLMDCLRLPIQCMMNLQEKCRIIFHGFQTEEELSSSICSHVITDKGWLQENILCLLSNAVKYSSDGEIEIKIELLHSKEQLKKQSFSVSEEVIIPPAPPSANVSSSTVSYIPSNHIKSSSAEQSHPSRSFLKVHSDEEHENNDNNSVGNHSNNSDNNNNNNNNKDNKINNPKIKIKRNKKINGINNKINNSNSNTNNNDVNNNNMNNNNMNNNNMNNNNINNNNNANTNNNNSNNNNNPENSHHSNSGSTEFLLFEVTDKGIGISEPTMRTLFNPFKQAQRLAGGTGLGLYSLAKRIEALKGCYGVHQREDGCQGSVFWFTIPYRPDQISADRSVASTVRLSTSGRDLDNSNHQVLTIRSRSSKTLLPVAPTTSGTASASLSSSPPTAVSYHVLIAEDSLPIAKTMSSMLRRQHHNPIVAENGEIAVNLLKTSYQLSNHIDTKENINHSNKSTKIIPNSTAIYSESTSNTISPQDLSPSISGHMSCYYDVVLMDFQMPVMDGLEATRRIRAFEKELLITRGIDRHQLIIGVSANSDDEARQEAIQAGIDDFLPKPFTMDAFFKIMKKFRP
jgi:CheY-like chemotaxis protein